MSTVWNRRCNRGQYCIGSNTRVIISPSLPSTGTIPNNGTMKVKKDYQVIIRPLLQSMLGFRQAIFRGAYHLQKSRGLTKQRCPRGYMAERDQQNRANFLPEIECDSAKPNVRSRKDIYPTGLKNWRSSCWRTLDIRATLLNTVLVFLSVVFSERFGSCIQDGGDEHNFERGPPKVHSDKVWLKLAKWFLTRVVSWFYKTFTPTTILVFNVNFQYNHKQVPTAYFSMMFNIHKHILNHFQNLFNVKTVS
jgi:hypothetical protein